MVPNIGSLFVVSNATFIRANYHRDNLTVSVKNFALALRWERSVYQLLNVGPAPRVSGNWWIAVSGDPLPNRGYKTTDELLYLDERNLLSDSQDDDGFR